MLDTLHKEGFLKKVPTSAVVSNDSTSFDDIPAQMAKIEAEAPHPAEKTETNAGERVQEQVIPKFR